MLTMKQAGCFYRAYKENKLKNFNDHLIGLMYEIAKFGFSPSDIKGALFFEHQYEMLNKAMNAIFAGEYKEAEEKMFNFLTCGKYKSLEQYLSLE